MRKNKWHRVQILKVLATAQSMSFLLSDSAMGGSKLMAPYLSGNAQAGIAFVALCHFICVCVYVHVCGVIFVALAKVNKHCHASLFPRIAKGDI